MQSRRFAITAATSLVLCALTLAAWLRSYAAETILFESEHGKLLLIGIDVDAKDVRERRDSTTLATFLMTLESVPPPNPSVPYTPPHEHRLLGFSLVRGDYGYLPINGGNNLWTPPFWIVGIPYWPLALLTLILPAAWLRRRRIAVRRHRRGQCSNCGYDLRATPDRCPECGTVALHS